MLTFSFRGSIADLDETTEIEPSHPTVALIMELGQDFVRVIVPDRVLAGRRELLCVDRPIDIRGEVLESSAGRFHVAGALHFHSAGH